MGRLEQDAQSHAAESLAEEIHHFVVAQVLEHGVRIERPERDLLVSVETALIETVEAARHRRPDRIERAIGVDPVLGVRGLTMLAAIGQDLANWL